MNVVVIGGTGLVGSKVVAKPDQHGHEAIAASPETGVNTLTVRAGRYPLDDLVRARLRAQGDTSRRVITNPQTRHYGVLLDDHALVPAATATVFPARFEDWLVDNVPARVR
jgi:hypothetical protein